MDKRELNNLAKRHYRKGYLAGRAGKWPDDFPPPPVAVMAKFVRQMKEMRDLCDGFRCVIDPEDEWAISLAAILDKADDAFAEINSWLLERLRPQPDSQSVASTAGK